MKTGLVALLAAALAAAIVAGCGGDDGGSDTTPADAPGPISKEEFVAEGNEICEASNEELVSGIEEFAEDNGLEGDDQPSQEQLDELASEVVLPSIANQVDAIRGLGIPKGQEKEVGAFLDNAETTIEELEADPSLLTDPQTSPFIEVNKEAIDLGLVSCGEAI